MVGRELTNIYPPKTNEIGDVLFEADNLSSEYARLNDVSFKARKGEIIGVAGLDGSGRTELLENIFGVATRRGGTLKLNGREIKNRNPRDSIKNGLPCLQRSAAQREFSEYSIFAKTRPFQALINAKKVRF